MEVRYEETPVPASSKKTHCARFACLWSDFLSSGYDLCTLYSSGKNRKYIYFRPKFGSFLLILVGSPSCLLHGEQHLATKLLATKFLVTKLCETNHLGTKLTKSTNPLWICQCTQIYLPSSKSFPTPRRPSLITKIFRCY